MKNLLQSSALAVLSLTLLSACGQPADEKKAMDAEIQSIYETVVTPENWADTNSSIISTLKTYCRTEGKPCLQRDNTKTYLSKAQTKLLVEKYDQTVLMKEEIENMEIARKRAEKEAARLAALPTRYVATIRNCVPLNDCRTINGSAWIQDKKLYLNIDESCPLKGWKEYDYGSHMGCEVTMSNGKPIKVHHWVNGGDEWDNEITATIGKEIKNPTTAQTANPFMTEYKERVAKMMTQWKAEEKRAEINCKGKWGDDWAKCAGAQ